MSGHNKNFQQSSKKQNEHKIIVVSHTPIMTMLRKKSGKQWNSQYPQANT
jgi:hypothetical protein